MSKYIVLGWTKAGDRQASPLGLGFFFGVKGGKLTFHSSLRPQVFNDRRTAKRAIDRSLAWDIANMNSSPWSIIKYAIERLEGI